MSNLISVYKHAYSSYITFHVFYHELCYFQQDKNLRNFHYYRFRKLNQMIGTTAIQDERGNYGTPRVYLIDLFFIYPKHNTIITIT